LRKNSKPKFLAFRTLHVVGKLFIFSRDLQKLPLDMSSKEISQKLDKKNKIFDSEYSHLIQEAKQEGIGNKGGGKKKERREEKNEKLTHLRLHHDSRIRHFSPNFDTRNSNSEIPPKFYSIS
jgi:hypothetical protein